MVTACFSPKPLSIHPGFAGICTRRRVGRGWGARKAMPARAVDIRTRTGGSEGLTCFFAAPRYQRERFPYGKLVEKHAKMTLEEANWRLSLTQPSGYSNSFSSGDEGKATRDDLHRMDWDGSSRRCWPGGGASPPVPLLEVGHSWTRKVGHR